jgi:tRNA A-37 threonylcarbamoyl transferase component Bud32
MSVKPDSCIKGIPAGIKKNVGIKTEYIKHYYHPNQSPEAVRDASRIAKRAAELGIGPQLYDIFVTMDTAGKVIIVKVSQIINGETWADTEWETPEEQHAAAEKLKAAIKKLNEAGIIHHDLHSGNVMVDTTGRVYIIDYDLAKFAKDEEYTKIHNFNESYPSEYDAVGVASDDGMDYVYNKLVEEGSIKEKATKNGGGKRRSKTRKHYIR